MLRPKPYKSPLWPHLETIRSMRRAHKTWAEIADHLEQTHTLKTDFTTICNFFRRVSKRKKQPLGFEPESFAAPEPDAAQPTITDEPAYKPGDKYRQVVKERKSKPDTFDLSKHII